MCGIAGWIGKSSGDPSNTANRMLAQLRHRGPDAQDLKIWPNAALLHARLKIIDLSAAGSQPMCNEDGSIWVAFNGEIYNHHEIRKWLESRGHRFRGRSDTEILPHLYEEEGIEFVRRIEGMFAIAIWDDRTHRLVLVRDRFGIKPLYYANINNDQLVFASEIPALREVPEINLKPDRQAIHDYASLLYIPGPRTFYQGIQALEPGGRLVVQEDWDSERGGRGIKTRLDRYHQWSIDVNHDWTLKQSALQVSEAIAGAVGSQIESDVPLGAFLSGGIDSSPVCSAATRALPQAKELRTFNARFSDDAYDETWAAHAVAEHIGSSHETLDIDQEPGTWEHITRLLEAAGQPFADTSLFPSNAICRLMRKHVTVALSGDGGDEGFGGYDIFHRCRQVAKFQTLLPFLRQRSIQTLQWLANKHWISGRWSQRFEALDNADDAAILEQLMCWIRPQEHALLCHDRGLEPVRRHFERAWTHSISNSHRDDRVERLSALCSEVHARLVLPYDFLHKVDIASMQESLEVRVPLLDEKLFALGLSLPDRLKVQGHQSKRVLRAIADQQLPRKVARKEKAGFAIPVDKWVDDSFKTQFRETLLSPSAKIREYFEPAVYQPIVQAFADSLPHPDYSRAGLYQRAIMLLALELHLNHHATTNSDTNPTRLTALAS